MKKTVVLRLQHFLLHPARSHAPGAFLLTFLLLCLLLPAGRCAAQTCSAWSNVGSAAFTTHATQFHSMAVDTAGTPYIAFQDGSVSSKATVMMFNGSAWVSVGAPGLSAAGIGYINIAFAPDNSPYIAYTDLSAGARMTVKRYDGSSWITVGSAGFSAGGISYPTIAFDGSGTPYVSYTDDGLAGKVVVKKYDGSNWVEVGGASVSSANGYYPSLVVDAGGIPYVAYYDASVGGKATVMKFDGANWGSVGPVGFTAGATNYTSLAMFGGELYLGFVDSYYGGKASVMKFDGTNWVYIGSPGFSTNLVTVCNLRFDGSGTPYIGYSENVADNFRASVMKYDGSNWVQVGSAEFSAGATAFTSTVVNRGGTIYVGYADMANAGKTTVMGYGLSIAISGAATVCHGGATILTNAMAGGTWSSSNISVATVGSSDGVVGGAAAGIVNITYTVAGSCFATHPITVNPLPNPGTISGVDIMCETGAVTMTASGTPGGVWSSSDTTIAAITPDNNVSGAGHGTVTISYTVSNGCGVMSATHATTVLPLPVAGIISGTTTVAVGATTNLATTGANCVWSSSNTGIATVGTTGVVTGISDGVAKISYGLAGSCGSSFTTVNVTVTTVCSTAVSTGTLIICNGSTTLLTNAIDDGTWSSSNPAVASVNGATGLVTGNAAGVADITYTTGAGPSCFSTVQVTINAAPAPVTIMGVPSVCTGTTITLSNAMGSGTWSSSGPGIATIGTYSGYLTGVAPGTATITFTQYTGCYTTRTQTVNVMPASVTVTGSAAICIGNTLSYNTVATGGRWASSHPAIAAVDSVTGIATGIMGGNATISYRMPTGCYSVLASTVNQLPLAITGTATLCEGASATLGSATAGGTWSSVDGGIASVAVTGITTGIAAGTTTISYTLSTGCARTKEVTVNAAPPSISGTAVICVGATSALANAAAGGTWSSSNAARATVGATTGVVTALSAGAANITYTVSGAGCYAVRQLTITATPAAITGVANVCVGSATTLGHATTDGTWASSNTAIAAVDAVTGEVSGISTGVVSITYTITPGCFKTTAFTVRALPTAITTAGVVCEGASLGLSSMPTGGTWTSAAIANATIGLTSGVLAGLAAGTTLVSYIASPGCMTTREITINAIPAAITGTAVVCTGSTTTLNGTPAAGTWSSSNTAKAIVDIAAGIVAGVAAGTATVTYTLATGCRRTVPVTVGSMPSAITGTLTVCAGSTTTLGSTPAGGSWFSDNTTAATIPAGSGLLSALSTGTAVVSYTKTGCTRTATVTVNTALPAIGGDAIVCIGNATALSNATTGGTWASSLTAKAIVNVGSGVLTGVAAGNSTITYRTTPTCYTTIQATVNSAVAAITGTNSVCAGMTTMLGTVATGGTWSSNNTAKAAIDAMTGEVTGVAAGSATISYILSTGCYKTITVVVSALPAAIGGTATVCEGAATTLTTTGGGTWSSGSAMATITASGVVTGVSSGFATITYRLSTGCISTREVTVNITPAAISGSTPICAGTTNEFSSSPEGGTWISSTPSVATVGSSSGIVTGNIGGGTTLTYILGTGCRRTQAIAVNPQPAAITGTASMFVGASTTLTSTTTGGTWSSSDVEVATVSTSPGFVTGVSAGTSTITYQVTATGCYRTRVVTVNMMPSSKPGTVEQAGGEAIFTVYPNPTTGSLTIHAGVNGMFSVYTLDGRQVAQYAVTTIATTISLPYNLTAGVYMCRFIGDDGSAKMVRLVSQP